MDGEATADEFYTSMVGQVGIQAKRAMTSAETQQNIVKQLTNLRESISGVSLDEEATKLIEYQKSFDASARLIRTADEMFDTVLNLKRM
jgi:flagellar hook-associated protein 1 FlgK